MQIYQYLCLAVIPWLRILQTPALYEGGSRGWSVAELTAAQLHGNSRRIATSDWASYLPGIPLVGAGQGAVAVGLVAGQLQFDKSFAAIGNSDVSAFRPLSDDYDNTLNRLTKAYKSYGWTSIFLNITMHGVCIASPGAVFMLLTKTWLLESFEISWTGYKVIVLVLIMYLVMREKAQGTSVNVTEPTTTTRAKRIKKV
jgi:hypothetical protein